MARTTDKTNRAGRDEENCYVRLYGYDAMVAPDPDEWLEMDEDEHIVAAEEHHLRDRPHELPRDPRVHSVIHAVVETQIASGDPAEAGQAVKRLVEAGLSRHEAIHAVGSVVVDVMHAVSRGDRGSVARYPERLAALDVKSWQSSGSESERAAAKPARPRKSVRAKSGRKTR